MQCVRTKQNSVLQKKPPLYVSANEGNDQHSDHKKAHVETQQQQNNKIIIIIKHVLRKVLMYKYNRFTTETNDISTMKSNNRIASTLYSLVT